MASLILNRGQLSTNIKEFIAETVSDMNSINLVQVAPGSKCLCLDSFVEYILSPEFHWVAIPVTNNGGGNVVPDGPIDLDGYATEKYVDDRIAFLINNETVDLDSIAELAAVLKEGGADLALIRTQIEEILAALEEKCSLKTFTDYVVEAGARHNELAQEIKNTNDALTAHKNNMAIIHNMQAQTDAKLMSDINDIEEILDDIKMGEALYRAQELGPVDIEANTFLVKHDNEGLGIEKYTDSSITAISVEGEDIVLKKFSGDGLTTSNVTYGAIREDEIITGNPNKKPLCIMGLTEHIAADNGWKMVLDKVNTGYAFGAEAFDIAWEGNARDGSVTPCVKIGDYYYELTYTRGKPKQLNLKGRFIEGVWNDGLIEADVNYKTVIDIAADTLMDTGIGRYYRIFENAKTGRIVFYLSYYEENGKKIGPFGGAITNGEFQVQSDLNVSNSKKIKYYLDNHRLISHYTKTQKISLDDLVAGHGNVITGNSPSVTNNGFSWGTNDPAETDNEKRLGTFSYLTKNRNLELHHIAHPVGNYAIEKIEGKVTKLDNGEEIAFTEASVRGYDLTMHPEFYPTATTGNKMYIQFITGRTRESKEKIRHFYRTLTEGFVVENGESTGKRRSWSPLIEILTSTTLYNELEKITNKYDAYIATFEQNINDLMAYILELQERVRVLEGMIIVPEPEPDPIEPETGMTINTTDVLVLQREQDGNNIYGGMLSGTYYPEGAVLEAEIIVTDYTVGDGGDFFMISDSFAQYGHFEFIVKNAGTAGAYHPSAIKLTLTHQNRTIEKIIPIQIG